MPLIEMLKDDHGADDGIQVRHYGAGNQYMVSDTLAYCFLERGTAKPVAEKAPEAAPAKAGRGKPEIKVVFPETKENEQEKAETKE